MAAANPVQLGLTTPKADPKPGPIIEYIGEGADKIKFEIDPKVTKYTVHANGMIVSTI